MSGKAYSMKEMKAIVEYLTEHRAYNEIKGRKMWMDLASSNVTTRTWQSLKETFLKRILPDIHNPYYKLSITQITSFRAGQDIEKKLTNKRLQIRSTSQDTDTNVNEQVTEKPGNSNEIEDKIAGEDHKLSNLRASTETLVLENCYETAEEIRKDLQSPTNEAEEDKEKKPTKTMRELLTYSEPLTPMLQSVIDDFVSDDEEGEPKMQIVEPEEATDRNNENIEENDTIEIFDSEGNDVREEPKQTKTIDDQPSSPNKNEHAVTSKSQELDITNQKSTTLLNQTNDTANGKDSSEVKNAENNNVKSSSEITQNNSASITDTFLPGNQEAFEENMKNLPEKRSSLRLNKKTIVENGRKRASSQDAGPKTKKRILSKLKSISDSEKSAPTNGNIFIKSKLSTVKQTLTEINKTSHVNKENFENSPTQKETAENSQDTIMKNTAEIENPCLKNVSLYAEQYSTEKYMDSDTSNMEDDKNDNIDKNKKNENIKDKNAKKNDKKKNSENKNENIVDRNDKTKKKKSNEIEKSSDKVGDTLDKNKKSDIKNKSVEDKQRIDANIEDKNENAVFKNKKIEISVKSNEIIDNRANKNIKKIDNNDKTDDKNKKYDKPRSTGGQACVRDSENDVMLKSYSDSVAESDNEVKRGKDQSERQQRDSALAHMFGFVSGGASKRQRRGTDRRKRTISHSHKRHSKYDNTSSASSDWTSDSGSELVSSPPRRDGRKGRYTRKYLKPRSAPILSLEEEGGLFVVYNNKIYPLVKDGKGVKNYVNYFPEDEVDPDESYWKLKYVEEKKKTAELTKLLNQTKDNEQQGETSRVPPVQANVENNNAIALREDPPLPESTKNVPEILPAKAPEPNPVAEEKKTVKIKFIKNNEEVQLEGHWSQVSPVLAHVAQLFQKEPEPAAPSCASVKTDSLAAEPIVDSGKSTPIEEVVEKVNQRENEIAQEIERYHKEEANASVALPQTQSNVTKRKGRPRKTSPAVPPSPAKIAKLDAEVSEPKESAEKTQQAAEVQDNNAVTTRRTRTPRNLLAETVEVNQNTIVKTRKTSSRKSQEKTVGETKQANVPDQEDDVRYKFPSPPPASRKSYTNKSKTNMAAKNTSLRNTKRTTNLFSAENVFLDSIDSMQGYQDSDISPSRLCIKRRRKTSLSFKTHRKRYSTRSRQKIRYPEMTSDSSNSYQRPRLKRMSFQNSTITSEIYRSESYRLLMNKDRKRTKNVSNLGKIAETSPASNEFDVNMEANKEIANCNIDLNNKENMSELLQTNTDDNSSNVSLPTSPVLSVVENISISKNRMDLMSSMELGDYPFEDKEEEQITLNELMTPNDDVTMPLMEQECGIEKSHQDGKAYHYNMSISKTDAAISESLLSKINTVNIQDPSISETLNVKLSNLLLESAKKLNMVKDTVDNENTHVDVKGKPGPKKARKRSSTPRKRQSTHKQKLTNTEPCIVEEHTESCSRFGRQSCPPIILISEHDCDETITPTVTESAQLLTVKPLIRGKKKKDIIKVKITKPKSKSQDNLNKQKTNFSDSGINETESEIILQMSDDSVEFIHNHSDTCLNAHECMEDSIKILDNPGQSIISLDSNTTDSDKIVSQHTVGDMFDKQEMFISDTQDGSDVVKEFDLVEPRQVNNSGTVYETPVGTPSSQNSVLTEDLSVEIPEQPARNSNWYLFSEEESSNTNFPNHYKNSEAIGIGSRLEQIFPITCAIPDLSTITELSRENGDSKQFSDSNTRTRDVSNSPNIFD